MEPNTEMSAYAWPAFRALGGRISTLSSILHEQRRAGEWEDPQIIDDLELAKFMAQLVLNYLWQHGALDVTDE